MSLVDALKKAGSQAAGNIEKAVIEIVDRRKRDVTGDPPVSVSGGSSSGAGSSSGTGGFQLGSLGTVSVAESVGSLAKAASGAAADAVSGAVSAVADKAQASVKAAADALAGGAGDGLQSAPVTLKRFIVQFNPSDLTIEGHGGGMVSKTNYGGGNDAGSISFEPASVRITMSVRLIFDKVDPQDAFMADKLDTSPTSVVTGVIKAGMTKAGKKENSVQTEVEGFMAALRSPLTSRISFQWGKMVYAGILNRVSAQYTMFNVTGQPVRAYVTLSLICADPNVEKDSLGVWQERYKAAFEKGDQSFVKAAQKAGNLLNFNL